MSKKIVQRLLMISVLGLIIGACGQKGPLTLPQKDQQQEQQKQQAEPTEQDKKGS